MSQQEVLQRELPARSRCRELQRGVLAWSRRECCQPCGASVALFCPPRRGAAARPRRRALLTAAAGVASGGGSSSPRSRAGTRRPSSWRSPPQRGARRRRASPGGPACSPVHRSPASPRRPGRARFAPSRGGKGQAGPVPASNFPRVCSGFPLPAGPASAPSVPEGGREGEWEGKGVSCRGCRHHRCRRCQRQIRDIKDLAGRRPLFQSVPWRGERPAAERQQLGAGRGQPQCVDYSPLQHAGATVQLKGVCTRPAGLDCSAAIPYEEGTSECGRGRRARGSRAGVAEGTCGRGAASAPGCARGSGRLSAIRRLRAWGGGEITAPGLQVSRCAAKRSGEGK